jgi:L-iditol 2-dehydrogenase
LGTFGDYYYVAPGTPVFRVPEELSDDVLGPVNCAMGTATQAVLSAGVGQGQTVVIQGAGGLGLTATAMAKDMGAHRVIVFDRQAKRLELAREFGADTTVNIEEVNTVDERVELVFDTTEGRGADVVLEFVGMPELVSEGLKMLRRGGTYVDVGQFFSRGVEFDPSMIVMTGKRLMGSAMYRPAVLSMILDFLVRTKDTRPFASLVSHRFALEDINTAFVQSEWVAQQTPIVRAAIVP